MYHVAWEAGRTREISTPPTCCSETCPRALGNPYNNYQSCASPRAPPASDFLCNYPPEKSMHPPPSPSSSLPLSLFIFILSPNPFFLSFISQTKFNKVHIRMQRNLPQGHFLPQPGAALLPGENPVTFPDIVKESLDNEIFLHLPPDKTL